jgi:hypothetical protein
MIAIYSPRRHPVRNGLTLPSYPLSVTSKTVVNNLFELSYASERRITAAEFQHLAQVLAAVEWFANIDNPRTRRAYQNDLEDFAVLWG